MSAKVVEVQERKRRILRRVVGLVPLQFAKSASVFFTDTVLAHMGFMMAIAVVGGVLSTWGAYGFHLPEMLGRLFAAWCIERGSCNLDINLLSVGLGMYVVIAIGVYFSFVISFNPFLKTEPESRQSIYDSVLYELDDIDEAGLTPAQIAERSGHDLVDVHTMLAYLFDDGRVVAVEGTKDDPRVRYKFVNRKPETKSASKPAEKWLSDTVALRPIIFIATLFMILFVAAGIVGLFAR